MTLTDLDDEPCRDDADKAATDHVDEAQAAKEKVSDEVRKPQGYDQERIYKGQSIAATVMRFVFAKKLYIGVPPFN